MIFSLTSLSFYLTGSINILLAVQFVFNLLFFQTSGITPELIGTMKKNMRIELESENKSITGNEKLYNENGDSLLIKNILNNENKIVFYFNQINCESCVEAEIQHILKMPNLIRNKKLILLSKYNDMKELMLFKRINRIDSLQIFNLKNGKLNLPFEDHNVPIVFVVTKNLKLEYLFVPNKNVHGLSENYYKVISHKLNIKL